MGKFGCCGTMGSPTRTGSGIAGVLTGSANGLRPPEEQSQGFLDEQDVPAGHLEHAEPLVYIGEPMKFPAENANSNRIIFYKNLKSFLNF